MATNKVLGQSYPSATTATTLYTCGVTNGTIVSTINVANLGGAADIIRIAIRPAGAALSNSQYIVYGLSLASGATFTWTAGAALANTDVITVYSANGTSAFSAFGQEQ